MFFPIFTLMRLAEVAEKSRYGKGPVKFHYPSSRVFTAKRAGRWKKSGSPIEKVSLVLPTDWTHEIGEDGKTCALNSPPDESGAAAMISVAILDGPDDARLAYDRLLQQQQAQDNFQLIDGGVVTRDRGLQAAHLKYSLKSEGWTVEVRELVFSIGFRTLAFIQSQCVTQCLPKHAAAIDSFFETVKPARRLDVPGTIKAGL